MLELVLFSKANKSTPELLFEGLQYIEKPIWFVSVYIPEVIKQWNGAKKE